jgi:type III pantothenate kinase
MLLVIDVGNTNIVLGLFQGEALIRQFRIQTVKGRTSDETGTLLVGLLAQAQLPSKLSGAILCCVVPDQVQMLTETCRTCFGVQPLVVGPGTRTGMPILADNPREVGADRIVNGVAAYSRVGAACIVVDFGTATTFDCISEAGEYLGGAIAPGYHISAEALFRSASKLPRVEAAQPPSVVGRNTIHSMQSGLYYGYVSLVDGMVDRITQELELQRPATVLATGGLAESIARSSTTITEVVLDLTLQGLRIIFNRNG